MCQQFMMASDCNADSAFDFPPLIQSMRLNIEGGPVYRGGRAGRAAAAYNREKEVIIAIKHKYGSRYGRRIQAYKPDTEAWRPERYQKRIGKLNCQNRPEIIPGGLQNKKPLMHIHHDWFANKSTRIDQQEESFKGNDIHDKHSSRSVKSEGEPVTVVGTSHSEDLAALGRSSQQGRGMMRGKRMVDVSAMFCANEKALTVNSDIDPDKRDTESTIKKNEVNIKSGSSGQPSSELTKSDEKEQITMNCIINPEKRYPESNSLEDEGNVRSCGSDQYHLGLIKSVGNLTIR